MSPLLVLLAVLSLATLLSQFGGRLAARHALIWWLVVGFFLFSAIAPEALEPIANALGIEFVSNFVLASMIVFLLYQVVEQIATTTEQTRGFRQLVSKLAAEDFLTRREESPRATAKKKKVLVVLPCFNEEDALPTMIDQLRGLPDDPAFDWDWCVVDDGSADASVALLRGHAPDHFTTHLANVGVAGVLLTGFRIVRAGGYDYAVQCDADGQHPVDQIPALVRAADSRQADLLIGSRFASSDDPAQDAMASTTGLRRLGGLLIIFVLGIFGAKAVVTDPTSGFRVYSKKAAGMLMRQMPDEYPEPEVVAIVALAGGKVDELRVRMSPRTTGASSIVGLGTVRYMLKVLTALLGLRLRSIVG